MIDNILNGCGYTTLFVWSILASTIIPIGSEGVMAVLVAKKYNLIGIAFVTAIGNLLGGCLCYWMGSVGRHDVLEKYFNITEVRLTKYEAIFNKWGVIALLFSWIPLVGDVLIICSGILKYNFRHFIGYVFVGKFARHLIFVYMLSLVM